jgi:hypothetical protein
LDSAVARLSAPSALSSNGFNTLASPFRHRPFPALTMRYVYRATLLKFSVAFTCRVTKRPLLGGKGRRGRRLWWPTTPGRGSALRGQCADTSGTPYSCQYNSTQNKAPPLHKRRGSWTPSIHTCTAERLLCRKLMMGKSTTHVKTNKKPLLRNALQEEGHTLLGTGSSTKITWA